MEGNMGRSSLLVQVVRASQKAARDAERARIRNLRDQARRAAAASREARREWIEDMQDEANSQTEDIQDQLREIDQILNDTLGKDDYFDLERLRKNVSHPYFSSKHLTPKPEPTYTQKPSVPEFKKPMLLTLFGWMLPQRFKANLLSRAQDAHQMVLEKWAANLSEIESQNEKVRDEWQVSEKERLEHLAEDEKNYQAECLAREIEIQKANAELDELISSLPRGKKQAVETYIELVLSESSYPSGLEPEYEVDFDELNREISVHIRLHHPSAIPDTAGFKFQKSSGEIIEKKQTQKEIRTRYEGYVGNSVIRTIHEILEADRNEIVRYVSVSAYVEHISPGTGQLSKTILVQVATPRDSFMALNLNNVIALETLGHLGAAISKNMLILSPVTVGKSVRRT
jgi:restriction system protein